MDEEGLQVFGNKEIKHAVLKKVSWNLGGDSVNREARVQKREGGLSVDREFRVMKGEKRYSCVLGA